MNKTDFSILIRGLKRMVFALATAVMFALSGWGFVETATATGYLAVLFFFISVAELGIALLFLYAQGLIRGRYQESKGERDE